MARLRFGLQGALFVSGEGPIRHSVAIQRLRSSSEAPEFLLNLYVTVDNPFEMGTVHERQIFTPAYLERDGVHYRIRMHWPAVDALDAHGYFERFAPAFFQGLRDPDSLIEILIAASAQAVRVQEYLAGPHLPPPPNDLAAIEFLAHISRARAAKSREGPAVNDELLSLLYWHRGETSMAIETVRRLRDRSPGASHHATAMRARMERRLAAMRL